MFLGAGSPWNRSRTLGTTRAISARLAGAVAIAPGRSSKLVTNAPIIPNGIRCSISKHCTRATAAPSSAAAVANRSASVDFPTPVSPVTSTCRVFSCRVDSQASDNNRYSAARPTKLRSAH